MRNQSTTTIVLSRSTLSRRTLPEGTVGLVLPSHYTSCLRSAVADSVSVDVDMFPYRRYGKFFWSDRKRMSRKHMAMMGHDGQQALIDLRGGRILVVFAICGDNAPNRTVKKLFD